MASYKILFKRSAEKELRRISPPYLGQIFKKIGLLSDAPRPSGVLMLKGERRYYRLRTGDYRIIYDINDETHEITILKIGHRREVYETD